MPGWRPWTTKWPSLQGSIGPRCASRTPEQAQQLATQYVHLKQARQIAADQLAHKQNVAAFERHRQQAQQVQQAHATLARELDGWSPQMAHRLMQYAMRQGIRPDELAQVSDPRLVKILHHAASNPAAQQTSPAAQRLAKTQAVRPAIVVGGTGGAPKDPNRMSTDDWMRHRRGQLRTKAR
jgi:hypothetical protein